jgi:hypothetical protein
MYTKDDVAHLVTDFGALKIDPAVEIETGQFGLVVYAFDPVSGQVITLAQPHRADIGQPMILLTAEQASGAVAAARAQHLHNVKAAGYASLEAYNEAMKRDAAARDLARKQAAERAKMDEAHAEAAAKAAEAAAPKKEPVKEPAPVA